MPYIFSFLLILVSFQVSAQVIQNGKEGVVSYKSSQNVYVKFETTKGIEIGDTLYTADGKTLIPILEVKHISSISCVGLPITAEMVDIGDILVAKQKLRPATSPAFDTITMQKQVEEPVASEQRPTSVIEVEPKRKENIRGRIGIGTHVYFSNTSVPSSRRMRYTFSLNANHIRNSRFSIESYMLFRHRSNEWSEVRENVANALKVYNLAVKYEPDDHTQVVIGRKINSHVSNIGAMDGLQFERKIRSFSIGAIIGTRPDYTDYSLNPNLFQYGGFVGHEVFSKNGQMQTSIAVLEQKNHGRTDRRFAYFQHSNALLKNLNLFSSIELDLFKVENEVSTSVLRPTSAYVSLRYRASRKLSFSTSYDQRLNVIYYESYKSFIDQLIEQETRQGLRFRFNYRPIKFMALGSSVGYRYQKNNQNTSKNLYSYLTFSRVPFLNLSATLSATLLETPFLKGGIYGLRCSKDLLKGKFFAGLNYRYVNYKYGNSLDRLKQNIASVNLSARVKKKLSLSINYEGTFEKHRTLNRIYANVIQRF